MLYSTQAFFDVMRSAGDAHATATTRVRALLKWLGYGASTETRRCDDGVLVLRRIEGDSLVVATVDAFDETARLRVSANCLGAQASWALVVLPDGAELWHRSALLSSDSPRARASFGTNAVRSDSDRLFLLLFNSASSLAVRVLRERVEEQRAPNQVLSRWREVLGAVAVRTKDAQSAPETTSLGVAA